MANIDPQLDAIQRLTNGVRPIDIRPINEQSILILPGLGRIQCIGARHDAESQTSVIFLSGRPGLPTLTLDFEEEVKDGHLVLYRPASQDEIRSFRMKKGGCRDDLLVMELLRLVDIDGNFVHLDRTDRKTTYIPI